MVEPNPELQKNAPNDQPMADHEKPFAYMFSIEFGDLIKEYSQAFEPSIEAVHAHSDRAIVYRLNLTEESTAGEVRKKVSRTQNGFYWFLDGSGGGNYRNTASDLYRVLQLTRDVHCFEDVLLFLHTGMNLPQIRQHHKQFHVQQ